MSRRTARWILICVVVMLVLPFATTSAGAANSPGQDLPTDLPTDDLPDLPTDEPSDDPSDDPSDLPDLPLPSEEPSEEPTEEPTEAPTEEPTDLPTDVPTDLPELEFTSEVTLTHVKGRFGGIVDSPEIFCLFDRTVLVRRLGKQSARTIGTAKTDDEGVWKLGKTTKKRGRYFARLKPLSIADVGNCMGAQSKRVRLR